MNFIKIIQNSTTSALVLTTALLTITGLGFPVISSSQSKPTKQETASDQKVQLMFVQTSEDLKVNSKDKTLRLVNVNPQTLYFSDRPKRVAGNLTMPAYFDEWTAKAGPDNFKNDPPNATLSVYDEPSANTWVSRLGHEVFQEYWKATAMDYGVVRNVNPLNKLPIPPKEAWDLDESKFESYRK
jgi:hypothetical protein